MVQMHGVAGNMGTMSVKIHFMYVAINDVFISPHSVDTQQYGLVGGSLHKGSIISVTEA